MNLPFFFNRVPRTYGGQSPEVPWVPHMWFDASDVATRYSATSGGSLVTSNGGGVRRLEDKTGNGRHLTTESPALLLHPFQNGLDVLSLESGVFLSGTADADMDASEMQIAMALRIVSASAMGYKGIIGIGNSGAGSDTDADQFVMDTGDTYNGLWDIGLRAVNSSLGLSHDILAGSALDWHTVVLRNSGGESKLWVDGVAISTDAYTDSPAPLRSGFSVGKRYTAGAFSGTSATIMLAEIMAGPPGNPGTVHGYLKSKWNTV